MHSFLTLFFLLLLLSSLSTTTPYCPTLPHPTLYGASILTLTTSLITNYTTSLPLGLYPNHGAINVTGLTFCNVSITYTHPGQNDVVNVQVFLPEVGKWNGRMLGVGGGGWVAGGVGSWDYNAMAAGASQNYATVTTDAGLTYLSPTSDPSSWALLSPGNVNLYLLQNLFTVSLSDASIIGKSVIESYYGTKPKYSYWTGCSQGGRQGFALAQRYPEAYDGIAASAPALYWGRGAVAGYGGAFTMNERREWPLGCEMDALTRAAVRACDKNDGVEDGVVTDFEGCGFEAESLVGRLIDCGAKGRVRISEAAAAVARAVWEGPKGGELWYGLSKDAVLTGEISLANTDCASAAGTCKAAPFSVPGEWIRYFVLKNASADLTTLTGKEYEGFFHRSVMEFGSMVETDDADLSAFRDRGGKIMGFHGLADQLIPPLASKRYYDSVKALDPNVQDYYRLFFAPGLGHCFGGAGAYPDDTFDKMVKWVEHGIAPDTLNATSMPDSEGKTFNRPLCAYPKKQYYKDSGDTRSGENFGCR